MTYPFHPGTSVESLLEEIEGLRAKGVRPELVLVSMNIREELFDQTAVLGIPFCLCPMLMAKEFAVVLRVR